MKNELGVYKANILSNRHGKLDKSDSFYRSLIQEIENYSREIIK